MTDTKKAVAAIDAKQSDLAFYDYGEDAGGGFGNQSAADYAIPFVDILQANSPELNENEQLRAGHLFNRTTQDWYSGKDGIVFVPAYTDRCYTEWVPRDSGGGYVGRHETQSREVLTAIPNAERRGKLVHPTSNNDLIETIYVYGIMIDPDGNPIQCVLPFTSTKIAVYRAWMTKARQQMAQRPDGRKVEIPLWGHRYRIRTKLVERNNYKWHNYDITFDGDTAMSARLRTDSDLYVMAKALFKAVSEGHAKADLARQGLQNNAPENGSLKEDEIPF